MVSISYPSSADWQQISGQATFFKPDNSDLDFDVKVSCNEHFIQEVGTAKMKKGWWSVKINWQSENKSYYFEEKIFIN